MFNALASSVRSSAARVSFANARTLHSTPVTAKSVTEKVSEVADKVNKGVGKRLASAIESGEKVTEATKETIGSATEKAKDTVGETSSVAGKKKNQAAAGIQEAKENIQKEAKN